MHFPLSSDIKLFCYIILCSFVVKSLEREFLAEFAKIDLSLRSIMGGRRKLYFANSVFTFAGWKLHHFIITAFPYATVISNFSLLVLL